MSIREVKFVCIDDWSRPVYQDDSGNYFGSIDKLVSNQAELDNIKDEDLVYFGRDLDCDPNGTPVKVRIIQ